MINPRCKHCGEFVPLGRSIVEHLFTNHFDWLCDQFEEVRP